MKLVLISGKEETYTWEAKSYWTTLKCLGLLKKTEYGECEPLTRYIRRYVTDRDILCCDVKTLFQNSFGIFLH